MTDPDRLPAPGTAEQVAEFLAAHYCWTAFWDKRHRTWRVAENDPDSDLYAEHPDAAVVIRYMTANS
jgi:hypothetical protein